MSSRACWYASAALPWWRFRIASTRGRRRDRGEDLAPTSRRGARRAAVRPPGSLPTSRGDRSGSGVLVSTTFMTACGSHVVVGVVATPASSASSSRQRVAVPDRERGRAEQAHEQRHPVPEQADADRLSGGDAERVQQQHEQALADPEARQRDRQHLGHRHRGDEGEHRGVGNRHAERVDRAPHRDHHRRLVRDRGDEHARRHAVARGGCGRRRRAPRR